METLKPFFVRISERVKDAAKQYVKEQRGINLGIYVENLIKKDLKIK